MKALKAMYTRFSTKLSEDRGATMVEYAMMVVAIAIVALVGVKAVGTQLNTTFGTDIKAEITKP